MMHFDYSPSVVNPIDSSAVADGVKININSYFRPHLFQNSLPSVSYRNLLPVTHYLAKFATRK